jgi:hypothetical protein
MLEQVAGHQVLEPHAVVAAHQAGVKKIDLGRLQDGARDVAVPGLHREDDEQRLQDVEVALEGGGDTARSRAMDASDSGEPTRSRSRSTNSA